MAYGLKACSCHPWSSKSFSVQKKKIFQRLFDFFHIILMIGSIPQLSVIMRKKSFNPSFCEKMKRSLGHYGSIFGLSYDYYYLPLRHWGPWYPGGHRHVYRFTPSIHVPPLRHGLLKHSSTSFEKKKNWTWYELLNMSSLSAWLDRVRCTANYVPLAQIN